MFRNREERRRRLQELIMRFRQKGATSPEKAMTIQELGLPPRFEEAMHRRLGQTGIFVRRGDKHYLNEERLRQIQEQRFKGRSGSGGTDVWRNTPSWLRFVGILLMLPIGFIITVFLFYFVLPKGGLFPGEFLLIFVAVFLASFIVRLLFWRSSRRDRIWQRRENNTVRLTAKLLINKFV